MNLPICFFYEGKANKGMLRYTVTFRCYSEWLERDSSDWDTRLALARVAALAGRTMKAVDIYEQLAGEDSLDFLSIISWLVCISK